MGLRLIITITSLLVGMTACSHKSTSKNSAGSSSRLSMESGIPDYHKAALVNVELGLGYLSQGQMARAKMKLTYAVKLAPNIPETHTAMAHFLEMVGDYKDSEREHKKAVSLSANKGAVYNNYGAFLCRRNRFKEADQAFRDALEDKYYARTAEVYENAGLCALKWPDQNKAKEYLSIAIRQDPNRTSALLELADINVRQGSFEVARDFLDRYRRVAEPSARSLWLGIQVAKGLHDDNGIASQALLLRNLFEESPEYQLYLKSENSNT